MNLRGSIAVVAALGFAAAYADAPTAATTPQTAGAEIPERHTTPGRAAVITDADVAVALRDLSSQYTDDEPIRVVDVGAGRVGIFVVGRPKKIGPAMIDAAGTVRVSEGLELTHVSAVMRILSGAGTLVIGGQLVDARAMSTNDPDAEVIGPGRRGKVIRGGESRRVSVGDMVIIPAGVPHGFSETDGPISYLVIRIDSGRHLPRK
jgi:mannose-6-phosphate isomerase-like protein (cupin superfamily)